MPKLSVITEEGTFSEEDENLLKKTLIAKILKFNRKNKISNENLSTENIVDGVEIANNKKGEVTYKCNFACHLCKNIEENKVIAHIIPCIHNTYWQIANLQRHLKVHKSTDETYSIANIQALEQLVGTSSQTSALASAHLSNN